MCVCVCVSVLVKYFIQVFFIEIFMSHHHLAVPPTRISLALSHHSSLSFIASGRSSALYPVSSQNCCK